MIMIIIIIIIIIVIIIAYYLTKEGKTEVTKYYQTD